MRYNKGSEEMKHDLKGLKIVLTGAPCSGKSSLIALLQKYGYHTVPEVFHMLYAQALENNSSDIFFNDQLALRYQLMHTQLDLESGLDSQRTTFLDRSAWDIIFFGEWYNIQMSADLYEMAYRQSYNIIFFLDLLPDQLYQTTQFRGESLSVAQTMHGFFLQKYMQTRLPIISVPFSTIENRIDYIFRQMELHKK